MIQSQFRQAHLFGESRRSTDVDKIASDEYDLMILVSSWDARCISLIDAKSITSEHSITIFFDLKDSVGLRERHDGFLRGFAESRCKHNTQIMGSSVNTEILWAKLLGAIEGVYALKKRRPLKIFLDVSTCPRVYTTAILGAIFRNGIAYTINMFYAEGEYLGNQGTIPDTFTNGRWSIKPVPGLIGQTDPGKSRFYLISVGFDGSKTYQAVSDKEPSRISLLFPDPGFLPEYTKQAENVNEQLIKEFCIPPDQIIRAAAGDAISAWNNLSLSPRERPESENTFYVCCGTKPHSIALALRAIALRYPAVLFYIPGEHRVVETKSSGIYWSYLIRDLTSLP